VRTFAVPNEKYARKKKRVKGPGKLEKKEFDGDGKNTQKKKSNNPPTKNPHKLQPPAAGEVKVGTRLEKFTGKKEIKLKRAGMSPEAREGD